MSKKPDTTKTKTESTQTVNGHPEVPSWWQPARESFSGRMQTNRQFADFIDGTMIVERTIHVRGSFTDRLGDISYALARADRLDVAKVETTLRDLFRVRTGETMNQLRERLVGREEKLSPAEKDRALTQALAIPGIVEVGDKLTFNRVFAAQAEDYADSLGITHVKARSLMAEAFEKAEGRSIWDWGKELDQQYFHAQVEAEKVERSTVVENGSDGQSTTRSRGRTRSGPSM